jgi:hypothetical protein
MDIKEVLFKLRQIGYEHVELAKKEEDIEELAETKQKTE